MAKPWPKSNRLGYYLSKSHSVFMNCFRSALLPSLLLVSFSYLSAQISFSNKTQLLSNQKNHSGSPIAVCDMNGDGADDIIRLNNAMELNIEFQGNANGPFSGKSVNNLPNVIDRQWGICTADVNNDGWADILTGGYYEGVKIGLATSPAGDYNFSNNQTVDLFVQGVNFADINNDGWLDAFVCHDDGTARIFGNDGTGQFNLQPTWINLATVPTSDNSGNYGSIWSDIDNDDDLDLYIAHCRQGVNNPNNPVRINQLFLNNGNNTFTQDVTGAHGLRIGAQSWTADFGDIDNDGDLDCFITNHDVSSQLLINDGAGHFSDITQNAGLQDLIAGLPIQGVFRDFDNDGYVDLLVSGDYHYLFRNLHNNTFEEVSGIFNSHQIESYAVGDLNSDGFLDIYAGYAETFNSPTTTPDVLWMNNGNNNHFIGFRLFGKQSNKGGVGAKVIIYSNLGKQTREVHSGESYGISNSLNVHFGLGLDEKVDSVVVKWPSGIRDVFYNPSINQYLQVSEGACLMSGINLTVQGPLVFCSGDSVVLAGPDGFDYLWNTGDTTQSIAATADGYYYLTLTDPLGCTAISNSAVVDVDPGQVPIIFAVSDTVFCRGGSVELVSTPASSYLWNTGATTQNITVSQSGSYFVSIQGICSPFNSSAINVTALDSPAPDIVTDTVLVNEMAVLVATDSSVNWYAEESSTSPLFTGNPYTTGPLQADTTFWASKVTIYQLPGDSVGMEDHMGSLFGDNNYNGILYFDCFKPFILSKVKVYTTKAGVRRVVLLDDQFNVINSKDINIPVGTNYIDLGMEVPVGIDLQLTTTPSE
jgi:hypothetical protein